MHLAADIREPLVCRPGEIAERACQWIVGDDPERAWATALSDARKHDSPNAGWPEAALAGALGFQLGGPRVYDGEQHDLPAFGDGRPDLTASDILKSLELYWVALNLLLAATLALGLILWRFAG